MIACDCASGSFLNNFFFAHHSSSVTTDKGLRMPRDGAILGCFTSYSAQQKYLLSQWLFFPTPLVWIIKRMEICWVKLLQEPFDKANKVDEYK